jgi:hypothetical protein
MWSSLGTGALKRPSKGNFDRQKVTLTVVISPRIIPLNRPISEADLEVPLCRHMR